MKASIVIRSYNEAKHIRKLILGIRAQTLPAHEIILVDSGSTDGTPEIARAMGVHVVPIDKRQFTFGRALNLGCRHATGDILVFVSAHVYPSYDTWLATLLAPFAESHVMLSYGRQRGNEVNKYSEHRIFEKWFPEQSVCPQKTYFCNNANCAVRRSAWETMPYDEALTGLEDLAWAKTMQERGGWIAYAADAEIIHVHDESWAQVQNRYRREAIAMRQIDSHARFGRFDFLKLLLGNVSADLRHALHDGVFRKEFRSILRFRWSQFTGTYKGYNDPPEVSADLRQRFYFPVMPKDRSREQSELEKHRIDYAQLMADDPPAPPRRPIAEVHPLRRGSDKR